MLWECCDSPRLRRSKFQFLFRNATAAVLNRQGGSVSLKLSPNTTNKRHLIRLVESMTWKCRKHHLLEREEDTRMAWTFLSLAAGQQRILSYMNTSSVLYEHLSSIKTHHDPLPETSFLGCRFDNVNFVSVITDVCDSASFVHDGGKLHMRYSGVDGMSVSAAPSLGVSTFAGE